jgi:hydrogenase maturation protease
MKCAVIETNKQKAVRQARILVIGYGNTMRRDDGSGVALAATLVEIWQAKGLPAALLTAVQLVPELAAEIAAHPVVAVVFVDAVAGLPPDAIQICRVQRKEASPALGHHLDPETLLTYAELLYECAVPAWIVTVPGVDFDHGEGVSQEVYRLLKNAPHLADELLAEIEDRVLCMK